MTNADAIRRMTDEELYVFIQTAEIGELNYGKTFCDRPYCDGKYNDCDECLKWWLQLDANKHPQGLCYIKKRRTPAYKNSAPMPQIKPAKEETI